MKINSDLTINKLAEINRFCSRFAQFGNDYIYCRFAPGNTDFGEFGIPSNISAMAVCLVRKGTLYGELDSTEINLSPDSLFVFGGNNIVHLKWDPEAAIEIDILFISPQFIHDLNFDLSAINLHSLVEQKPDRVYTSVPEIELEKFNHLMEMLYLTAKHDAETPFAKNTARCLAQVLFYQLLSLHEKRQRERAANSPSAPQSRQATYVFEFMNLLRVHHTQQRSISFYADKLFISPKYLSHLIKEATGKSASDIIGQMVIQEAKNLLRYSTKNIQQIAYDLNFSTQSSFGKYFKHFTGLSPTEFQRK